MVLPALPSLKPHPFAVSLETFAGPLDLLLRLVEAAQLEITLISLVQVTGQYLAYMRAGDTIDHRALADFVAIGARLIELKSRALLPPRERLPETADEDEASDDLVAMLLDYQQFKQVAGRLREREEAGSRAFPRLAPAADVPELAGLGDVTLDRLLALMRRALARAAPEPEPPRLLRPRFSVRQKMAELSYLLTESTAVAFSGVIAACRSREEMITCFLALLELDQGEAARGGPGGSVPGDPPHRHERPAARGGRRCRRGRARTGTCRDGLKWGRPTAHLRPGAQSPSLPGFMRCNGSRPAFSAFINLKPLPCSRGMRPARRSPAP